MRNKEVINVSDGCRIGCVNDVEVDMKCAKLVSIVIYGKLKFFGLFGRDDDIIIKWENIEGLIEVIGEDTILVKFNPVFNKRRGARLFKKFFKV